MFTKLRTLLALLFALTLVAAACGSDEDDTTADDTTTTTEVAAESETEDTEPAADDSADDEAMEDESDDEATEDEATEDEVGTVVDVAVASGDFPTLVAALQAAGLDTVLAGEGPFTVFAPTEEAFAAALSDLGLTAEELLASDDLSGILTYHVLPTEAKAETVLTLDGEEVETVNGATVTITIDGDTVMVNDAVVTSTDIVASNGVIHVIDSVLLPPAS